MRAVRRSLAQGFRAWGRFDALGNGRILDSCLSMRVNNVVTANVFSSVCRPDVLSHDIRIS